MAIATEPHLIFIHANKSVHAQFAHVENFPIKHAGDSQPIRSLLRALPKHKHGCIVFMCPEFERRGVLKRAYGIFFREGNCVRSL